MQVHVWAGSRKRHRIYGEQLSRDLRSVMSHTSHIAHPLDAGNEANTSA